MEHHLQTYPNGTAIEPKVGHILFDTNRASPLILRRTWRHPVLLRQSL
jgi:hypothetical protein